MANAERTETVDVPMKDLYKVITNYEDYPNFVNGLKSLKVEHDGGTGPLVHFDIEMVKRIQYSVRMNESIDEAAGHAEVEWSLAKSEFFKLNDGSWKLKALGPNRTEVTYGLKLEFTFPIPGFVLKGMVSKALPQTIEDFAERAKKATSK